jgi:primosomal protein N' (replication factor Y)
MGDIPERISPAPDKPVGRSVTPKRSGAKRAKQPAETLPVARVAVDMSLPHLDRPFDYLVPATLDAAAVPGCRVRVRFAGQLVDGFLLERVERSDHEGRLAYLERVTSSEPVLAPEIAALARELADRYAGTLADVLRLAVPPRHARVEAENRDEPAAPEPPIPEAGEAAAIEDADGAGTRSGEDRPENGTPTAEAAGTLRGGADGDGRRESAADEATTDEVAPGEAVPGEVAPGAAADEAPAVETAPVDGVPGEVMTREVAASEPASGVEVASGEAVVGEAAREAAEEAAADVHVEAGPWQAYPAGSSFLDALRAGRAPRAIWSALPGEDWTPAVARAARAALAGGRGVLVIVPDGRDVARVDAALTGELGPDRHVALTAELGPAERYRRWLAVRRGRVKVVVGTRAAMFAPVRDLGLVVLWDDGDDVHAEPHAPYPHAREVLALRAHRTGAGALIGGFTRTTDATQLVRADWAHPLVPDRERLRASMAYIRPSGDDADLARDEAARSARLPHVAFRTARQGLEHGPVLVQVPRRGYVPALACSRCRGPARCPECEGPLSLRSSHAAPYCRWCGRIAGAWQCPECDGRQVRAVVVGARRTAEELGRAFPGVPVRTSGRDGVLTEVTGEPALVVATPGAEPVAEGGYAAALLLDGWVLLGRADLRAGEEALRRWMNAAALVRPRGPVVVLADGSLAPVQALIRWDAVTYAERELAERRDLGFPPAVRMASLTGSPQSVRELVDAAGLPEDAEVLGPVEVGEDQERALVRVDRSRGVALSRLLKAAQAARSTRRTTDVVRVRVDPLELI